MGFLDLQKVVHLVPEEISEEEKENLYVDFIDFEIHDEVDTEDLIKLFQICQEILKYKGEQVESRVLYINFICCCNIMNAFHRLNRLY